MHYNRRKARIEILTLTLLAITLGLATTSEATLPRSSPSPAVESQQPPTGTLFDHIVFIIMENEGIQNICAMNPPPCNGSNTPYMSGLANSYGIGSQYLSVFGSSEPNYVAILGGSLEGCGSGGCPVITAPNLVDRFEANSLTWKAYMENQTPTAGCDTSTHGFYEHEHNPFVEFKDITNNTSRCNKIFLANPSSCGSQTDCVLVKDLNNATVAAPNFMWLTPNDCNNMHASSGCPNGCTSGGSSTCITDGDNYLKSLVPNILKSRTFNNTRAALFITFDEGQGFCPLNNSSEDCLYAVWSGPLAKTGFVTSNLYNQYSLTKTIETNWGLASFTTNDGNATPMSEFFKTQPPDYTITATPGTLSFPTGGSANSTITLQSTNNFAGTITLTKTSHPTGLTVTLNPTSVTLTAGGTKTSTLTVSSSTIGSYNVTVIGTSGSLSHNTTIPVTVTPPPDFTITANPNSLTLGQISNSTSNPVTISPTGDRTVFETSYLTNSFNAKGLYWIFYEDSRNNCEHQAGCLTYTTSLNGSSWATPTTVPVHITDSDFSVYTDGSNIYYVRYNETSFDTSCGRNIQFRIGTLSTSGTISWQPEQTVATGAANRAYINDEIIVDSNGQAWIAYTIDNHSACGGNSTERPQVIHSTGTNYASWTGNTTLTTAHSATWHIALASLGNGQVYATFWIPNGDLHGRLYNGSWQSDEQISPTNTQNDINAWLFNSGTNIYTVYYDNRTENYNFALRSSTGTWTISTIGRAETHSGTRAFNPAYYSLPDAASYDTTDNLVYLFYMNSTTRKIDQWRGTGSNWTRTNGIVSTSTVPYADSLTSFIQSSAGLITGALFYISGSSSPFNLNEATLSFTTNGATGSFTVTITGQNGFTGTVTLTTTISPSTGLTINCNPTTIPGGSGTSTCILTSQTPGNYTVTVKGTSGSLNHSAVVNVSVPSTADFTVTATTVTANAGQNSTSTITIMAVMGFTGTVTLTDTVPSGLTCNPITPGTVTGSGTANLTCHSQNAGNYTATITGTSGTLIHNASATFRIQDFTITVTSPPALKVHDTGSSTITIASLNHFAGVVSLTDIAPSLTCGPITPTTITGAGMATVSCSAGSAGNYTATITGTSGSLVHSANATFMIQDFTIAATSPAPLKIRDTGTSSVTITSLNHFSGLVSLTGVIAPGLTCGPITPTTITGHGTATVSCSAGTPANYTITIISTIGSLSHNATATLQVIDFSLQSPTPQITLSVGSNSTTPLTLTSLNGYAGSINLTVTVQNTFTIGGEGGSGAGGHFTTFAPPQQLPTATLSTYTIFLANNQNLQPNLNITIASTVPVGDYPITVTAIDGGVSKTIQIILHVVDFTITSPVNSLTVPIGGNSTQTLTLQSLNGFQGIIAFSASFNATGPTASISPSTIHLTLVGNSTILTILVPPGTTAGNYTLTIQALSGSLSHSIVINISVPSSGMTAALIRFLTSNNSTILALLLSLTMLAVLPTRIRKEPRAVKKSKDYLATTALRSSPKFTSIAPVYGLSSRERDYS